MAAAIAVAGGASAPAPAGDRGDTIAAEARKAFDALDAKIGRAGCSNDPDGGALAWSESYILMAFVAMFEGTGDRQHLDRLQEHADRILANRADRRGVKDAIRGQVVPAWASSTYSDGKPYCWIVHAGMITFPLARWSYLARKDPALAAKYGATADRYVKDVAETVAAFDPHWRDGPKEGEGYYYGAHLKRALPLNQQNALGRTIVALWLATGDEKYRQRGEKLARYFKNRIRKEASRYVWPYWPEGDPEDISHAAINVDFAFQCYRAGLVFDAADMQAFAETLKACARGDKGFTKRVDASGDFEYSAQAGRWLHLAFVDASLRGLCFNYLRRHWDASGATSLLSAAYLVETARPFAREAPVRPTSQRVESRP